MNGQPLTIVVLLIILWLFYKFFVSFQQCIDHSGINATRKLNLMYSLVQMDLKGTNRTFYPIATEYTFFSSTHGKF